MKPSGQYIVSSKRALFAQAMMLLCLVLFSSLVFSFQLVSDQANRNAGSDLVHNTPGHFIGQHHSGHLPLLPGPTPLEPPIQDERQKDGCDDDEITKLFSCFSLEVKETLHSKEDLFSHLKFSEENRSSVSLVILYQCWKSYLI